mgnify:CR=1 FL=1
MSNSKIIEASATNEMGVEPEQAHIDELPQKVANSLARHGIINLLQDDESHS